MLATCVTQPIDMIKVRIQLGQGSAGQVTRTMIKEEGFGSLYKSFKYRFFCRASSQTYTQVGASLLRFIKGNEKPRLLNRR
ncbi:mitochondrial dicarboxylate/tricarboxylate transporter DTC-like [Rosa rugosa]|uniref:mitochondrial dicarboxylate/tricarboxylate transporter DTC-like n=1 Tax=Rosa rugosa TaxID=74645 RepID=UPI002B41663F|nr:mitochondrial dicarboxylate/tricarboxylate transporter DTC-like [Rosa rugosa]